MPSAIDPTFVTDGNPVSKSAFRDQLLTLRAEVDHGGFVVNPTTLVESTTQQALDDVYDAIGAVVGGRVATIADLQTVPPAPGLAIEVLGYHAPGDGGGGLFYADLTGAQATDGGTVFGYTGDQDAGATTEAGLSAALFLMDRSALAGADLAFDSVQVTPDEAGNPLVFDMWDLHGHQGLGGDHEVLPMIDLKTGTWNGPENPYFRGYINGRSPNTVTITYRTYGANTRRWVRLMPGDAIDVRWFGAQPGQNGYAARNRICWAMNAAKRWGKRHVSLNGAYLCEGTVEIPNRVFVRDGSLKVPDGRAVPWLRQDYATSNPYREKVVATGGWPHGIAYESGAAEVGLIRFEYDGNFEGNLEPCQSPQLYTDPYDLVGMGTPASLGDMLQNTQVWMGLNLGVAGGRTPADGQQVTLEDVHLHGTGSNAMGNDARAYITARGLKLGNSVRNHLFYNMHGQIDGLTIYGFAWGSYGKTEGCNITGFNVEGLVDGKATHGWDALNQDGGWGNAPNLIAYEGQRWGAAKLTGAEDARWGQRKGLNITGFNIDLEGFPASASGPLFTYTGMQFTLSDGVILGPKSAHDLPVVLVRESMLGGVADEGLYNGISVRHVRLIQRGQPLTLMSNHDLHADQSGFVDVSIEDERGYEGESEVLGWPFVIRADTQDRGDPKYGMGPRQMHAHGVTIKPASFGIAFVDVLSAAAHPLDFHFSACVFPLVSNTVLKTNAGPGGTLAGLTVQDPGKIRLYMDRCRFTLGGDTNWGNCELFFALTRFRGCVTMDGLVSEESGEATLTAAGGETALDVPTRLFWAPGTIHITPRSAAGAARFAYVEVLANGGTGAIAGVADKRQPVLRLHFDQALGAGEVVALGWDAAVRPF